MYKVSKAFFEQKRFNSGELNKVYCTQNPHFCIKHIRLNMCLFCIVEICALQIIMFTVHFCLVLFTYQHDASAQQKAFAYLTQRENSEKLIHKVHKAKLVQKRCKPGA